MKRILWRRQRLAMLLVSLLLTLLSASSVLANGKPIKVVLMYLPELSTSGPQSATGVAELVTAEGEVHVSVTGLPTLDQEVYAVWLLNTQTQESMRVATFNTTARSARVDNVLPAEIPERGWNVVLVTIEPSADVTQPGSKRSIAGYFPEVAPGSGTPQQLPRTGGDTLAAPTSASAGDAVVNQWALYLGAAVVVVTVAAVAYGLGATRVRR